MSITLFQPAANIDVLPAFNYFEIRDGRLRLKPRSHLNPAHICDVALGPITPPTGALSTTRVATPEIALESDFHNLNVVAVAPSYYVGAYEALKINSVSIGAIRLNAKAAQRNSSEFTIHAMVTINTVGNGDVMSEFMNTAGLIRWRVRLISGTRIWFQIYNAAGVFTTIDVNPLLNGITLVNGDVVYFKISYFGITDVDSIASIKAWVTRAVPNDWVKIADTRDNTSKLMPTVEFEQDAGLAFGTEHTNLGNPSGSVLVATINMLRRFKTFSVTDELKPDTSYPSVFETTATGALVTFDAGENDVVFDPSSISGDGTLFAAAVGLEGYTVQYECANVLTGVYSAEMTGLDFISLPPLTGRYLQLKLTCRTDGFNNYSIGWLCIAFDPPVVGMSRPHSYVKKAPHSREVE